MKVDEAFLLKRREELGLRLREIREKKGLSQEQLADIMNVSRTTISKIESGKFNCSYDYIIKFSAVLDFDVVIKEKNS